MNNILKEIYQELVEFCDITDFSPIEKKFIKRCLRRAYIEGEIATLAEQIGRDIERLETKVDLERLEEADKHKQNFRKA